MSNDVITTSVDADPEYIAVAAPNARYKATAGNSLLDHFQVFFDLVLVLQVLSTQVWIGLLATVRVTDKNWISEANDILAKS